MKDEIINRGTPSLLFCANFAPRSSFLAPLVRDRDAQQTNESFNGLVLGKVGIVSFCFCFLNEKYNITDFFFCLGRRHRRCGCTACGCLNFTNYVTKGRPCRHAHKTGRTILKSDTNLNTTRQHAASAQVNNQSRVRSNRKARDQPHQDRPAKEQKKTRLGIKHRSSRIYTRDVCVPSLLLLTIFF